MRGLLLAAVLAGGFASRADAVVVELKDVAADRIERQRAASQGNIPLPDTPNIAQLDRRLAEKGVKLGSEVMVRIFKAESLLELWMKKGDRFIHFASYPICYWSGTLGPKVTEGDQQSPEGVYTVSQRQLHLIGRWPRSLNLGFPNSFDRSHARTGSYLLVHGGCSSVGCYSMTNPVIEEIFSIVERSLKSGQDHVQVQVYPFRLTEENLRAFVLHEWYDFWRNLKDVYDSFERTKLPPRVSVCERRYWVEDATRPGEVAADGPLAGCGVLSAATEAMQEEMAAASARISRIRPSPRSISTALLRSQSRSASLQSAPSSETSQASATGPQSPPSSGPSQVLPSRPRAASPHASAPSRNGLGMTPPSRPAAGSPPHGATPGAPPQTATAASSRTIARAQILCAETRPSCRRWVALQSGAAGRRRAIAGGGRTSRPDRS
jgi:murein L,D-transpeptidase YafK